jgi:uncharacterized membrane protein YoaK (UPF0700 family)
MPYHSATTDHDRPRLWVYAGGAALTGVAGFVNALLIVSVYQVPVSHMTGAVSKIGIDLVKGEHQELLTILSIVGGFLLGAVVSGMVIGGSDLRPGRRYGVALMLEGAAFGLAATGVATVGLVAFGCGLQNGLASSYLGLVLRTTHVTGIVTDLGVLIGQGIRERRWVWWKIGLLAVLLGGFFTGGLLALPVYQVLGSHALGVVAAGVCITGLVYLVWRHLCVQRERRS